MMEGKVRAALQFLTGSNGSGTVPLDKVVHPESDTKITVRDVLLNKHPPRQQPSLSSLNEPDSPPLEPHPVLFEAIDGQLISNTVLKIDRTAGPLGLDVAAWKRMCTSFKTASADLHVCQSLTGAARWLCSEYVDPSGILLWLLAG